MRKTVSDKSLDTVSQILFFGRNKKINTTAEENMKPRATLTFIFIAPETNDLRKSLRVIQPISTSTPINIVITAAVKEIILEGLLFIELVKNKCC